MACVAVTGGSGHVGAPLVRQLLEQGHRVRVLVREDPIPRALRGLDVEAVRGDVRARETLPALVEGVDVVYHLAAVISIVGPMNGEVHAVNVVGTRNVGEAALAAGVRRMVHVCSVHAFDLGDGSNGPSTIDEAHVRSDDGCAAYDASKAAGEAEIRKLVERGLDAVIVHPSAVVGPYDFRPSRMGKVLLSLGRGRMPGLIGGGFDWVDVRDVCHGIRAAADKGRTNHSYILSGHYASLPEVAAIAAPLMGARPPRLVVPVGLAGVFAPAAEVTAQILKTEPLYTRESLHAVRANARFDRRKAGQELDYAPRPLADTIRDTYAWFAAEGALDRAPDGAGPVSLA